MRTNRGEVEKDSHNANPTREAPTWSSARTINQHKKRGQVEDVPARSSRHKEKAAVL
jgi:hypothetical protein